MEDLTISDNPYYRELVNLRQTLQGWFHGLTPAADESETFTRILRVAPEDGAYIREDGRRFLDTKEYLNRFRQAHGDVPA